MENDEDTFMMNINSNLDTMTALALNKGNNTMTSKEKSKIKKEKYKEKRLLMNKRKRDKGLSISNMPLNPNEIEEKKNDNINKPNDETRNIFLYMNNKKQKIAHTQPRPHTQTKHQQHRDQLKKEINYEIGQLSTITTTDKDKLDLSSNPQTTVFSIKTFDDLKINDYLKKCLAKNNYTTMTKIQKKSIPILLEHKNVVVKSETGSGKTLAYLIPLYEQLINLNMESKIDRKQGVYAIIFSPTHELCLQIEETFNKIKSSCINVVYGNLMGGQKMESEKKKLRKGLNVIIATPGRLLYHMKNTASLNFSTLKTIIFDEADLLLSMGFEKDIKECFRIILKKEQGNYIETLNPDLFKKYKIFLISATIDNKIRLMTNYLMKGFKAVGFEQNTKQSMSNTNKIIGEGNNGEDNGNANADNDGEEELKIQPPNGLEQYYSFINEEFRLIHLLAFLYNNTGSKMMIFVSTCDCVNFLNDILSSIDIDPLYEIDTKNKSKKDDQQPKQYQHSANAIKIIPHKVYKLHGKMKHDERKAIFSEYNHNKSGILIATDVAARGLDFPSVDWVIHYDVNPDIKEYTNRMGRTARLDCKGNSLLFLMKNEQKLLDTCFLPLKPKMTEILGSSILLQFIKNINSNVLKTPIDFHPMPFDNEVDENEKYRKKYIFAILPLQRCIRDFIFADKENMLLARQAFKSEVRSYITFIKYNKEVFNIKVLNLTRLSRSFGLYKETMKMKVGSKEVYIDHEFEKTNTKAERKINNKRIQNKMMFSEFE